MSKRNKHNLSRKIPAPIMREVRKRCGFGCVICGIGIYEYDHFEPEWAEAKKHTVDGITLLCGNCHNKKTRGLLSKETVMLANKKPQCTQTGYSNETFDFQGDIQILFGTNFLKKVGSGDLLSVNNRSILRIDPPESPGGPILLSGVFCNDKGDEIFEIRQNEWRSFRDNSWDIETEGRRITIRRDMRKIALALRLEPPGQIVIERISMRYQNVMFHGDIDGSFFICVGKSISGFHNSGFNGSVSINSTVPLSAPEIIYNNISNFKKSAVDIPTVAPC